MSRILRRPMFRGGPVSSYGTGIASGLGDNRQNFFEGGISTAMMNELTGGSNVRGRIPTGGQILSQARAPIQGPPISPQLKAIQNRIANQGKSVARSRLTQGLFNRLGSFAGRFPMTASTGLMGLTMSGPAFLAYMNAPKTVEELNYMKEMNESGVFDETASEEDILAYETERARLREEGTPLGTDGAGYTSSTTELKDIIDDQLQLKDAKKALEIKKDKKRQEEENEYKVQQVKSEEPELTVDDYIELLGGTKARRRDVGDMLGRASAAFLGAGDVKEGFAEFMKTESAAGPSRREKIEQTAAMIDIKDKQAGKRAKEQIGMFMEQEKFRNKLATERGKGTVIDQYLNARKTTSKPGSAIAAVKNSVPEFRNSLSKTVSKKDKKNVNVTQDDVGTLFAIENEDGSYTINIVTIVDSKAILKPVFKTPD